MHLMLAREKVRREVQGGSYEYIRARGAAAKQDALKSQSRLVSLIRIVIMFVKLVHGIAFGKFGRDKQTIIRESESWLS
jgi:hypothetical protein